MLESFPVILIVGTVLGFLSGLGIGGGSLLILWLTIVLDMDQQTARSINLLFFLPSAVIACLFRWRQGCLKLRHVLPAAITGCICAGISSVLSLSLDISILRKLFGGLLVVTGIRELLYRPKSAFREEC